MTRFFRATGRMVGGYLIICALTAALALAYLLVSLMIAAIL